MPVYSPAFAVTHKPTLEGWYAELALVSIVMCRSRSFVCRLSYLLAISIKQYR